MENKIKKILIIFGTRPEAIKLAPLIKEFQKNERFNVKVCVTAQHREMLDQVLDFFNIFPDFDLNLMKPNQTLFDITANSLKGIEGVLDQFLPDVIFVQGDTTTVLTGALAGFYKKIKIAHIEAGLRTFDKYSPFPEEINRVLTTRLTDFHFTPTKQASENLKSENVKENIYMVGNTVIDALHLGLQIIQNNGEEKYRDFFKKINFKKKVILVTAHRRENLGKPLENIFNSILEIANTEKDDVEFVYPVHLNPNVRDLAYKMLSDKENIKLIDPLEYPYLIWLMNKSYMVLTDSGGIQEEAPSLGKPVVVLRDVTERMEGVEAGTAVLVGSNKVKIIDVVTKLIHNGDFYKQMSEAVNPYGNGTSSKKIVEIIENLGN